MTSTFLGLALALSPDVQAADAGSATAIPEPVASTASPPLMPLNQAHPQWRSQVMLSGAWAFVSLNYIYCDLIDFMDPEMHAGYHTGTIDGFEFTPGFLAGATLVMQVPLSMVLLSTALPPGASRIANIAAGLWTTGIQTATLFVGKPSPHYAVSSAIEIATTAFITSYAIWGMKPGRVTPQVGMSPGGPTVGLRVALR